MDGSENSSDAQSKIQLSDSEAREICDRIRMRAKDAGFELCGITSADPPETASQLFDWLDQGMAGEMSYMERRREAYADLNRVLEGARTVIVLATNYNTAATHEAAVGAGRISRYAWGRSDYHDMLRERMRQVTDVLHAAVPGCRSRCIVDTAPVLERDLARRAGLGWFGKNTMLINKWIGSWFFLSAILTDVELPADERHKTDHCGTCSRCLDECPTDAFTKAGELDARKCISYLTIELRNQSIPTQLRSGMQDWLFGCDVCQDVCPWNRKAPVCSDESEFQPIDGETAVGLKLLLAMDDEAFDLRFGNTPLSRPGREGVLRNACLVLGNQKDESAVNALITAARCELVLVRIAAVWALGQIATDKAWSALESLGRSELDEGVLAEINAARSGNRG